MKKILFLIFSIALYAYSINCVEAEFLTQTSEYALFDPNYDGYVLDSSHLVYEDNENIYRKYFYSNHKLDSVYRYEIEKIVEFGQEITKQSVYEKLIVTDYSIEKMKNEIEVTYKETELQKDGDSFYFNRRHSIYLSKDSIHIKNNVLQEDESSFKDEDYFYIKENTLYYLLGGEDGGSVIQDPDNPNRCYDNRIEATIDYEIKNDTLIRIYKVHGDYIRYEFYIPLTKLSKDTDDSNDKSKKPEINNEGDDELNNPDDTDDSSDEQKKPETNNESDDGLNNPGDIDDSSDESKKPETNNESEGGLNNPDDTDKQLEQESNAITRKVAPSSTSGKFKYFDLMGRPAKQKQHIIKVGK